MKPLITKEYLYHYFDGKATSLQKQYIDEWVKHPDNMEFFYECLAQWEKQHLQYWAPAQQGYHRHIRRIKDFNADKNLAETTAPNQEKKPFSFLIAASVGLLCLIGLSFFFKETIFNITYTTTFGETQKITLDDGSEVFLNANSSLTVPRFGFSNYTRSVALTGEASFSIKHLPDNQHFIVRTDNQFEVEVLGTDFLIFSRERGGKVVLLKGEVQFKGLEKQITMKPGDLVTVTANGVTAFSQSKNPEKFSLWKEHRFVFEETTLEELAFIIQENFGLVLVLPDKEIAKWTISGSFPAKNIEELLATISVASNLNFKKEGKKVIIVQ
ncbi:FecR family protein [Arcicella lustrica]|uniref:FecR domain-containing protein n=1 Tax=Arcicella lustrica TaxID=2984196 RepID=A0ABU5SPT2_9BACT|nr:FecR domain-containing protein [Arcicella sp. DC25W]MEA5429280.1 FecR domain-containing protein [Arcicella sp. DC25W]